MRAIKPSRVVTKRTSFISQLLRKPRDFSHSLQESPDKTWATSCPIEPGGAILVVSKGLTREPVQNRSNFCGQGMLRVALGHGGQELEPSKNRKLLISLWCS